MLSAIQQILHKRTGLALHNFSQYKKEIVRKAVLGNKCNRGIIYSFGKKIAILILNWKRSEAIYFLK